MMHISSSVGLGLGTEPQQNEPRSRSLKLKSAHKLVVLQNSLVPQLSSICRRQPNLEDNFPAFSLKKSSFAISMQGSVGGLT